MNVQNIKILRDHLRTLRRSNFGMKSWCRNMFGTIVLVDMLSSQEREVIRHDCGTVACVGGWTEILFGEDARTALGLSPEQGSELFFPDEYQAIPYTKEDAVVVLDYLLKTGEVDWTITKTLKKFRQDVLERSK